MTAASLNLKVLTVVGITKRFNVPPMPANNFTKKRFFVLFGEKKLGNSLFLSTLKKDTINPIFDYK